MILNVVFRMHYILAHSYQLLFFKMFFVDLPHFGYLYFSYFSMNEPELGAGIDPGMAFNPFPCSILVKTRRDSNPTF
jgi:hypothetical protein